MKEAEKIHSTNTRGNQEKISTSTKNLMERRRHLKKKNDTNAAALKQLNKDFNKAVRKDLRQYNTNQITSVIEANKCMKVLRKRLTGDNKNICKHGQITSNKNEILIIVVEYL